MTDTYWENLPCLAIRGTAIVAPWHGVEFWGEDLVGKRILVVRIIPAGEVDRKGYIYLDNRQGAGWAIVTRFYRSTTPFESQGRIDVEENSFDSVETNHYHITTNHHDEKQPWCDKCGLTEQFLYPILVAGWGSND